MNVEDAKKRLDGIIDKARVDLYKPIQIAEVLKKSRERKITLSTLSEYKNPSIHWRNEVTQRLAGKSSSSSANYQHAVWNEISQNALEVLDVENKKTSGAVERYVYMKYQERQGTVAEIISAVDGASPERFHLEELLELFEIRAGIRRSVDKAYEIVVYSLFETLVTQLQATVKVKIPERNRKLLSRFASLGEILLGVGPDCLEWESPAHIYRVGVTNAADRGLDMWANFGPAIQVKHLTLSRKLAVAIVDQVESDNIVVVCRTFDREVIETLISQIGWGARVRGIVTEHQLAGWYSEALRGEFKEKLAVPLLELLGSGFRREFPQAVTVAEFLEERGYLNLAPPAFWLTSEESN